MGFIQILWKVPEQLAPYLLQMDVLGEHSTLKHTAYLSYFIIGFASILLGLFYASFGQQLVFLWVGEEFAPVNASNFIFAGGAIFWLGISRLPVVFASACLALRQMNFVLGAELLLKSILCLLLYPHFSYLAVLIAVNLTHCLGISFLYFRLLGCKSNVLNSDIENKKC